MRRVEFLRGTKLFYIWNFLVLKNYIYGTKWFKRVFVDSNPYTLRSIKYLLSNYRRNNMEINFEEMKKIHDAVTNASDAYMLKSFKPWESDSGKQYITIQLVQKD